MTDAQPVLTIAMPSFNMEAYLGECLNKLLSASNRDKMEIIVVNDGSRDRTLEIAKEYQSRYPRVVKIIDKENGHYGTCINAALAVARGKYFRILDADDWFEVDVLEEFIRRLESCESDLVVTLRVEVILNKDNKEKKRRYIPIESVTYNREYDARTFSIQQHSRGVEFNMHSMTFATAILRQAGTTLPGGVCYTDLLFCMYPIGIIRTLVVYDLYLYHYRVGREGASTTAASLKRNILHTVTVLTAMDKFLEKNASDLPVVNENQRRFMNEALQVFMNSLRYRVHVGRELYKHCAYVLSLVRKYDLHDRFLTKYYFKYWVRTGNRRVLNASLLIEKLTHPSLHLKK